MVDDEEPESIPKSQRSASRAKVVTGAERKSVASKRGRGRGSRGGRASIASRASLMEDQANESSISPIPTKSRRGRSKKSEIPATQEVIHEEEEKLELPVLEEEPSQKKGRKGRASAPPKQNMLDLDEGDDNKSKTTRGGKKSARGRGSRGKASIASQRSGVTSRRGRGKKVEEESMPILPSQEVSAI